MERFTQQGKDQNLENAKTPEQAIQEVSDALASIDQDSLRDVFLDTLRPAGAEDMMGGFLSMDKVKVIHDKNIRSRGLFKSKADDIDQANIVINADKFSKLKDRDVPLAVIYTYIHEEVHALSTDYKKHRSYDTDVPDQKFVGFKKIEKGFYDTEEKAVYTQINEGMTELIAEEIAYEYLRRTGEVSGKHRDMHHVENSLAVYMEYKVLVDGIISQLAAKLEQTPDTIRKSLVVEFFKHKAPGDNFTDWLERHYPDIAKIAKEPEKPPFQI